MLANKISWLPEEKKLFALVHHPIVIFSHLFFSAIILLLDFFMMYYLFLQGWWGVTLFGAVLVVAILYAWRMIFLWKKNFVLITDKRILDFEQVGFFEHYVSEFFLTEIKNVEICHRGLAAKIFGYGNLRFVFSDEQSPFEIYKVRKPFFWQEKLSELLVKNKKDIETGSAVDSLVGEAEKLTPQEKQEICRRLQSGDSGDKNNLIF